MLKVKNMKFSNLILVVGTIGIATALDRNETLVSTSSGIGNVNGNETSLVDMLPSLLVESTNICISTLILSTCACEPKESKGIDTPGESPKYEGDEWDRYAETPKAVSTTLIPDYVLRTNFSTSRPSHGDSLDKNGGTSSVSITHSKSLENQTMTSSMTSEHGIQSLTFPSIYISSTHGHYPNTLTSVDHSVSFNTGYHNSSINTGYRNISSTTHNVSLSTYISTSEHTTIGWTSSTSSEEIVTTVAETETPTSQTQPLHRNTDTIQDLNTNTAKSEHPTTDETKYADNEERTTSHTETVNLLVSSLVPYNILTSTIIESDSNTAETSSAYETEDHKTVLETSCESSEGSVTTSMETKVTMEPSLFLDHPHTTSQKTMTSHASYINQPTTLPEDKWSDYWSDENWSEEWPSEFWSDVFKEPSKTDNEADWKTHSAVGKNSISPHTKTKTNTGKKSHSELRSTSKGIVHSTSTSEGSFRILPTSHMPKQTSPSTENTSHEHQTDEHHTEEHNTGEHHTEEHHTEEHHTEEHHTEQLHPAEPTISLSESYEHTHHISESSSQTMAKSNEETHVSSTPKNNVMPTSINSKSNVPKLSHTEYSSVTTEEGPTSFSRIPPSTTPSAPQSLSTYSTGRHHSGSPYNPRTSYSSKRSRLSTTVSISPELTSTLPTLSRVYPRKLSYSPIFTLKPAPSQLGIENTRQAKPLSQPNPEETETETETLYITLLSSTESSKSMIISGHLEQSTSGESSTVSTYGSISSTLARPWHILKPEEETESNEHESNASTIGVYYLLLVPCFIFIVLL